MTRDKRLKSMKQLSLSETGFLPKAGKQTRKAVFLSEMETAVPWSRLESLNEPFYPKKGSGPPPVQLGTMLRTHFMQQWFGYSDPAMQEALHDVPLPRQYAALDALEDAMPDESTIPRFRHMLGQHELAVATFAEVNALLAENSLRMKRGSLVDATPIAAPNSTKNQNNQRDPEVTQTRKGNQWYFGMTSRARWESAGQCGEAGCGLERRDAAQVAHIRVDTESGLIHSFEFTTTTVAENPMMQDHLHGERSLVLGERGYCTKSRTVEDFEKDDGLSILTLTKKPADGQLPEEQGIFNRMLRVVRAIVEHSFRVLMKQFGSTKVRYRGLTKNTEKIVTPFALTNPRLARGRLLQLTRCTWVRP